MFNKNPDALKILQDDIRNVNIPEGFAYTVPPNSFKELHGEFLDYTPRTELLVSFNIDTKYSNPQGSVQGGIIAACFDDVFGPLGMIAARHPVMSIDMNVQYMRSVHIQEPIYVRATLVSMGKSTLFIRAEMFNKKARLMAQASTNLQVVRTKVPV